MLPGQREAFLRASLETIEAARKAARCRAFVVAADPIETDVAKRLRRMGLRGGPARLPRRGTAGGPAQPDRQRQRTAARGLEKRSGL